MNNRVKKTLEVLLQNGVEASVANNVLRFTDFRGIERYVMFDFLGEDFIASVFFTYQQGVTRAMSPYHILAIAKEGEE